MLTFQTHCPGNGVQFTSPFVAIWYSLFSSKSPWLNAFQASLSSPLATKEKGVALIFWTILSRISIETFDQFHPSPELTSFTLRFSSSQVSGPSIKLFMGPSIAQLSFQKFSLLSRPKIHLVPFLKIFSPLPMAAHTLELGSLFGFLAISLLLVKYLLFSTFVHKASFSVWKHQLSLANRNGFLPLVKWIPSPPSSFAFAIYFQPTQWTFFLVSKETHRKFLLTRSIFSNSLARRSLHCITYTRILAEDVWTKTVLPTKDKRLAFHLTSLCLTLSNTKLKSWLLQPLGLMGNPRYLPRFEVDWKPKMSHRDSQVSLSALGEKNTLYLVALTVYLDLLQNSSSTSLIAEKFAASAFVKNTRSSVRKQSHSLKF